MKKKVIALLLTLVFTISVVACSNSASKDSGKYSGAYYSTERYDDEMKSAPEEMWTEASEPSAVNTTKAQSDTLRAETNRKLIRDASLSMETKEFDVIISSLQEQVNGFGGYVESMDETGRSYRSTTLRRANLTARIPADRLDDFMNVVGELGNITQKNLSARDVTSRYVDIESRLGVLNTEKESLQKIMATADNTTDMLEVQSRLYDVIEEIEAYEAQKRSYDSLIAFSTVTITVQEVEELTPPKEETRGEEFARRFTTSLSNLGEAIVNFLMGLIIALPWLLVFGVVALGITLAIVLPIRAKRKKRRAAKEQEAK